MIDRTFCPECQFSLKVGPRPHKGQRLSCPECQTKLVVTDIAPLTVDLATFRASATVTQGNTIDIDCPECDGFVRLSVKVPEGYQLTCEHCQTPLQVVSINPIDLDVALPTRLKQRRPPKEIERRKPVNGKKAAKSQNKSKPHKMKKRPNPA